MELVRYDQKAKALEVGAIEVSALCAALMVAIALTQPHQGALIAFFAALDSAAVCFVWWRYVRHIWSYDNQLAVVAMKAWLIVSLMWLPFAVSR